MSESIGETDDLKYAWIGLGVTTVVVSALVIALYYRSKPKVDLSVFDSPDIEGSGKCMNPKLIEMLIELQKESKLPIFNSINSGARSPYWNKRVGGVSTSAHLIPTCKAVDISTPSRAIQKHLVDAAVKVGFNRFGIGRTFVHLDIDETKRPFAVWGYPSSAKPPFNPFA